MTRRLYTPCISDSFLSPVGMRYKVNVLIFNHATLGRNITVTKKSDVDD